MKTWNLKSITKYLTLIGNFVLVGLRKKNKDFCFFCQQQNSVMFSVVISIIVEKYIYCIVKCISLVENIIL